MINYNHIYYFYEVARFNSVTKAAEHLRLSQPSLSIQIKTLEQQLGFKLFEKKGRNIVLTDRGQRLYAQNVAPCFKALTSWSRALTKKIIQKI